MTCSTEVASSGSLVRELRIPIAHLITLFRVRNFLRIHSHLPRPVTEKLGNIRGKEGVVFFLSDQFFSVIEGDGPLSRLVHRLFDSYYIVLSDQTIHEVSIGQDGRCYTCSGGTLRFSEFSLYGLSIDDAAVILVDQLLPLEYVPAFFQSVHSLVDSSNGVDPDED